jgi:hypothetical protein
MYTLLKPFILQFKSDLHGTPSFHDRNESGDKYNLKVIIDYPTSCWLAYCVNITHYANCPCVEQYQQEVTYSSRQTK